jgi:competence protein ComEC
VKVLVAFVALLLVAGWSRAGRADYLEVRRNTLLKSKAERGARTVATLVPSTLLQLVSAEQVSGYYRVETRGGARGFVYRTLVRRHRGSLPAAPTNRGEQQEAGESEDEQVSLVEADVPEVGRPGPRLDLQRLPTLGSAGLPEMRVHLIDVGQGQALLFEFSCGAALVDTGGESNALFDSGGALENYLEAFFERRADLDRTLDLLVITHPHLDHVLNVELVTRQFKVKNVVTDGLATGSGRAQQGRLEAWAKTNARLATISEEAVPVGGLRNAVIDPIHCSDADPGIKALWGGVLARPDGWSKKSFDNENSHSVVLRLDFGEASFVVPGDLELEGIEKLLEKHGAATLDVDVFQVGHHGSKNAVTHELLAAVSPDLALIGTGSPARETQWSAWQYGHPRKEAIDLLLEQLSRTRPRATVPVASAQWTFADMKLDKAIYATGWDGSVVVTATTEGALSVLTER